MTVRDRAPDLGQRYRNLKFYAPLKRALNPMLVGKTRPPIPAPHPPAWIGGPSTNPGYPCCSPFPSSSGAAPRPPSAPSPGAPRLRSRGGRRKQRLAVGVAHNVADRYSPGAAGRREAARCVGHSGEMCAAALHLSLPDEASDFAVGLPLHSPCHLLPEPRQRRLPAFGLELLRMLRGQLRRELRSLPAGCFVAARCVAR